MNPYLKLDADIINKVGIKLIKSRMLFSSSDSRSLGPVFFILQLTKNKGQRIFLQKKIDFCKKIFDFCVLSVRQNW